MSCSVRAPCCSLCLEEQQRAEESNGGRERQENSRRTSWRTQSRSCDSRTAAAPLPRAPAAFFALSQRRHARLLIRLQGEQMRSPTHQTDKTQPAGGKEHQPRESSWFKTLFSLKKMKKRFSQLNFLWSFCQYIFWPPHPPLLDLHTPLPSNLLCVTSCLVGGRKWIFGHTFPPSIPASNQRPVCARSEAAPVKVVATKKNAFFHFLCFHLQTTS